MSRAITQQGNTPIVGQSIIPNLKRGVYGSKINESGRKYGTTAEDLRSFPNKDVGEEDNRSFDVSNYMNTDNFRVRREKNYFEYRQEEYPSVLNLKLKQNTFSTRMTSSYFFFEVTGKVTVPKQTPATEDVPAVPTKITDLACLNYKFFRMLKECHIEVGANCQEICLHLNCFNQLHRIMYMLQQPISRSNALNEFAMCDMFSEFHLDDYDSNNSCHLAANNYNFRLIGLDPTFVNDTDSDVDKDFTIQLVVPLSLIHPFFDHDTVLPPGLDIDFKFEFFRGDDLVKKIFILPSGKDGWKVDAKINMKNCFLFVEQPEQVPRILMNLKTRNYKFSPIVLPIPYVCQITKPSGQLTVEQFLIPENGKMPVKFDFMLINNEDMGKALFKSQNMHYLDSFRCNINQPFPAHRQFEYYTKAILPNVKVPTENSARKDINFVLPEFQQHHNLLYSLFGEQYVWKGFRPPIKGAIPIIEYLNSSWFSKVEPSKITELVKINNDQQFQQGILQPSNIFNGLPYPVVRGSLGVVLKFQEKYQADTLNLTVLCNFYYNYELHIENDKVSFLLLEDLGVNLDSAKKGS